MRVLLLQPNQEEGLGLQSLMQVEPLGLQMVAGALGKAHEVRLLDLRVEGPALDTVLADFRPQLVGASSSFTMGMPQALSIAEHAKAVCPEVFTIMGGQHPSLHPEDFHHPAVDAIVVGEAEATIRELVAGLAQDADLRTIPGLVLNRPEGQLFTGARAPIADLDSLPYPDRSLTRHIRRHYHLFRRSPIAAVETTRGCPHRCSFCAVWRFYEGKVRFKSPERVTSELEATEETDIFFTDDNFLSSTSRVQEIARLIRERRLRKRYFIQARSDSIVQHPEVLANWREIGLDNVFIGFERPDQQGLNALNKHNSTENNEAALAMLRRLGIEPLTSFIVDPDYGHEGFALLREYVRRLHLKRPLFSVLTPLPGTAFFEEVKERLITTDYHRFDMFHSVVPTRLKPADFYQELAALYRSAYPRWKLALGQAVMALADLFDTGSRPYSQRGLLVDVRQLGQAETYAQ